MKAGVVRLEQHGVKQDRLQSDSLKDDYQDSSSKTTETSPFICKLVFSMEFDRISTIPELLRIPLMLKETMQTPCTVFLSAGCIDISYCKLLV